MPQITLERSANVESAMSNRAILSRIHRILSETGGIRLANCKSRARTVDDFLVGEGHDEGAFVHLDVRFLQGRPDAVRSALGVEILQFLKQAFPPADNPTGLQITVEIGEIAEAAYFKHPEGTFTKQA